MESIDNTGLSLPRELVASPYMQQEAAFLQGMTAACTPGHADFDEIAVFVAREIESGSWILDYAQGLPSLDKSEITEKVTTLKQHMDTWIVNDNNRAYTEDDVKAIIRQWNELGICSLISISKKSVLRKVSMLEASVASLSVSGSSNETNRQAIIDLADYKMTGDGPTDPDATGTLVFSLSNLNEPEDRLSLKFCQIYGDYSLHGEIGRKFVNSINLDGKPYLSRVVISDHGWEIVFTQSEMSTLGEYWQLPVKYWPMKTRENPSLRSMLENFDLNQDDVDRRFYPLLTIHARLVWYLSSLSHREFIEIFDEVLKDYLLFATVGMPNTGSRFTDTKKDFSRRKGDSNFPKVLIGLDEKVKGKMQLILIPVNRSGVKQLDKKRYTLTVFDGDEKVLCDEVSENSSYNFHIFEACALVSGESMRFTIDELTGEVKLYLK